MLSDLYDWLDHVSLRVPVAGPVAGWLLRSARKLFQALRDLAPEVVRLEGTIGGHPVTVRVAGDPKWTVGWVARALDGATVSPERRVRPFGLPRALSRWTRDAAVVLIQQSVWTLRRSRGRYDLILPRYVSSIVRFGPDWPPEAGWRSNHRHLRGSRLLFRVTHDAGAVKAFYREMYRPTMLRRHGPGAVLLSETAIRLYAARGGLLEVFERGPEARALGGVVFELKGSVLQAAAMGVAGGDPARYRRGVGLALYFYLLTWARQQGLDAVDLGGSAPVLTSGHLAYKARWGSVMVRPPGPVFGAGLRFSREPAQKEAVCRFLGAAPPVFVAGDGLAALVCRPHSGPEAGPLPTKGLSHLVALDCSKTDRCHFLGGERLGDPGALVVEGIP